MGLAACGDLGDWGFFTGDDEGVDGPRNDASRALISVAGLCWISSYLLCLRRKKIYSVQRRNSSSTWYHTSNLLVHHNRLTGSQARKKKADKYKDVGDPIVLPGVPIDIQIRGNYAWVAGSDHAARKIDLQVYIHPPRTHYQTVMLTLVAR